MKTPTTAGALRVARALLGYSQQEVAGEIGLTQRAIWQAETSKNKNFELNLDLVAFYKTRDIEFVGETRFGDHVFRAGACWSSARSSHTLDQPRTDPHSAVTGASFVAARALLGLGQAEVGEVVILSRVVVAALEKSEAWDDRHELLRAFYDKRGVEFLGWGQPGTNRFYGIGVRWKGFEPTAAEGSSDVDDDFKDDADA